MKEGGVPDDMDAHLDAMPTFDSRKEDTSRSTMGPEARVWLLLDDRPGHRTQVRGLARLLGVVGEEKPLAFSWINRLPNPLLGASLLSINADKSAALQAPWPDLVVAMGRRSVPVVRWIKKQSDGRTRILLLGRKGANDMAGIDLALVCAHFQMPPHGRRRTIVSPPTQVHQALLAAELARHGDPLSEVKPPRALFLIGGPTAQHRLTATYAGTMAAAVAAAAKEAGLGLSIITSRRTPAAAINAIREAAPEAHFHLWRADATENPYLAYLAAADYLVVTGESESMLAEAVATEKPLTIYPLESRPLTAKQQLIAGLSRLGKGPGILAAFPRFLVERGWMTPLRDLGLMHRMLMAEGRAEVFDGKINREEPKPSGEFAEIADQVWALLGYKAKPVAGSGDA